jgi:nucleoside-diphosphate-sugar epimerase
MRTNDATILVTGASGFVGNALVRELIRCGRPVLAASRKQKMDRNTIPAPSLSALSDWRHSVEGADVVVHTAARVHIMNDRATDPMAAFQSANVDGTLALARQAVDAGVKRFVFISSIKVNGELTMPGQKFTPHDAPRPLDPYGMSKANAETGLQEIALGTKMELVIIRPPLVYGPGVKANFHNMMRWLRRGVPLPFGGIRNQRSLVGLDNLVDFIKTCIDHPAAADQIFLAGDGQDMSTPELLRRVATAMGTKARLLPFPEQFLHAAAFMLGKPAVAERLCSSLQIDISATEMLLGWQPPISVEEGLRKTALAFLNR